jgi:cell division protein FtsW
MKKTIDKPLFISILVLIIAGFFIFSSASLGLLARDGAKFSNVAFSQVFYGLILGSIFLISALHIPLNFWKKNALLLFFLSICLTLLVFVPGLNFEHGGAKRWVSFGGISFQPAEFLKIGFIIYIASWLSSIKHNVKTFRYGFLPFMIISGILGAVLLSQPDTDTFFVTFLAGLSMFLVGGARLKHITLIFIIAVIGFGLIAVSRPYLMQRLTTFINPAGDSLGSSYQIQQSLIAIGSGGLAGKGFGQSVQKFSFLPEPIGDSIFAVAGEEFGFIGSVLIIAMFAFFAFRGLKVAGHTSDTFGGLLATGIVIMIVSQSFINMASMVNVFPLSGIPLPFISHGGTALMMTLAEMGILLNISKKK